MTTKAAAATMTTTEMTTTTRALLKHEWLRTRGPLGTLFGLIALVGVLGSLLGASGWPVLTTLGLALGFLTAVVAVPAVQLVLAADYWRSGYGRTGYFTHSLPVRGSRIYRAKLVWAMVASMVAIVLTAVLGVLAWWAFARNSSASGPSWSALANVWDVVFSAAPVWMIVLGVIAALSWVLVWPVFYFFAVSVGHERRFAPLGAAGPVVVFVLVYIAMQALSMLGMFVLPVGIGMGEDGTLGVGGFDLAAELAAGTNSSDVMPIGFLVSVIVLGAVCVWRTARSWNHRVALA